MKKLFLISVVVCLFLISCNGQKETPTIMPSSTPESQTLATLTPTKIHVFPTFTPIPQYPIKEVAFDFKVIGDHSPYDDFFVNFPISHSNLVIYTDGQIIIPSEIYKQKTLSQDEVKQFLLKLKNMGFYSLESNQKHDPTDKLYNFGDKYEEVFDGRWFCVLINGNNAKDLCAREPYFHFLVPEMMSIINFLEEYKPEGMTPYYPDRILLWVQVRRLAYDDNLPENAIPWDESLPSIETRTEKVIYVDGVMAKEIYTLFDNTTYQGRVFNQNGKEYAVYMKIILPHEEIQSPYQ